MMHAVWPLQAEPPRHSQDKFAAGGRVGCK
jgi:hypothetical protein